MWLSSLIIITSYSFLWLFYEIFSCKRQHNDSSVCPTVAQNKTKTMHLVTKTTWPQPLKNVNSSVGNNNNNNTGTELKLLSKLLFDSFTQGTAWQTQTVLGNKNKELEGKKKTPQKTEKLNKEIKLICWSNVWECYLKDVDEINSDSELGKEEQYILNCLNVLLANLKTKAHVQTHAKYIIL